MSARKTLPVGAPVLTGRKLRAWSLHHEEETGYDSIPTIEEKYEQTPQGAYVCCFPGCVYARRNAEDLWLHVHYSAKHVRDTSRSREEL